MMHRQTRRYNYTYDYIYPFLVCVLDTVLPAFRPNLAEVVSAT
jgi:hypothetical protein